MKGQRTNADLAGANGKSYMDKTHRLEVRTGGSHTREECVTNRSAVTVCFPPVQDSVTTILQPYFAGGRTSLGSYCGDQRHLARAWGRAHPESCRADGFKRSIMQGPLVERRHQGAH